VLLNSLDDRVPVNYPCMLPSDRLTLSRGQSIEIRNPQTQTRCISAVVPPFLVRCSRVIGERNRAKRKVFSGTAKGGAGADAAAEPQNHQGGGEVGRGLRGPRTSGDAGRAAGVVCCRTETPPQKAGAPGTSSGRWWRRRR